MLSVFKSVSLKQSARAFSTSRPAMDLSRLTLIGRLGNDPVLRETTTGKPYYTYSVATSIGSGTVDESGNRIEPTTSWHTIFAFYEPTHKSLARVGKGSTVYVEAELEMRPGGNAPDGSPLPDTPLLKHQKINVIKRVKPQSELETTADE